MLGKNYDASEFQIYDNALFATQKTVNVSTTLFHQRKGLTITRLQVHTPPMSLTYY